MEPLLCGPGAASLEGSALCLETGSGQLGVGFPGSLEQPVLFWSAVQRLISASESPKHRGKGGGVAKRNVWLYFLDRFSVSGDLDGAMHPWEMLPIIDGVITQRLCAGECDDWVDSSFLGTTWPLLLVSQDPCHESSLLLPCLTHLEASTCSTTPSKPLALRSCFVHSLLSYH